MQHTECCFDFLMAYAAAMKRVAVSVLALVMLYAATAWAFDFWPFKAEPTYFVNVPSTGQAYTCNGGTGPSIFIRFSNEGQIAIVRERTREIRLTFVGDSGADEVYQAGPWELTLDPEAALTGPDTKYQNCY